LYFYTTSETKENEVCVFLFSRRFRVVTCLF